MFGQMRSSRRSGPSCSRKTGCPCECHPPLRTPEQEAQRDASNKKELRVISTLLFLCISFLICLLAYSCTHPSPPPCYRTIFIKDLNRECRLGRDCTSTGACGPDYVYCDFTGPANGGTHCDAKNR